MTHLKRLLWLAAWGVWLWLGVGLYRELPRDLGPKVCDLPLEPYEAVRGFLGNLPSVVTEQGLPTEPALIYRVRSGLTGEVERTMPFDPPAGAATPTWALAGHGFVVAYEEETPGTKTAGDVAVLDLHTGARRDLPKLGAYQGAYGAASDRPWGVFTHRRSLDEQSTAVDLATGRVLFQRNHRPLSDGWRPFFIGNLLAVPVRSGAADRLAIHELPSGKLVQHLDYPDGHITASESGKVAWYLNHERLEVFDRLGGTRLLQDAAPAGVGADMRYPPLLAPDERTVLSPGTGALIEIDSGRLLWRARRNEVATSAVPPDRFLTTETWRLGLGDWAWEFETFVTRRFADGSLVHRTWWPLADWISADGGLVIAERAVHRLPPVIIWWHWTFCQAILALPLVLPWAFLRWKRRWRARHQSTEAAP